jgi:acetolactate synthase-1/2/3 large subunit
VRYVFGHPGGEVVDLIDGFASAGLEFVLTKHEATAGFMADAVGAFGGAPGVCIGTLGPGATNLVTGVAQSFLDRSPVIAITGQLPADRYDVVTHQRLDLRALFAPITKWQAHVTAANAITVTDRAIRVSKRHRPGPVYLEVPSDVPAQEAHVGPLPRDLDFSAAATFAPGAGDAAASLLRQSRHPVIVAGMDAMDVAAVDELRALADEWVIPVVVGPKAKGVVREDHPLFLGTIEALGTGWLFDYIAGCDLVVMVGFEPVEFDRDWTGKAKIIHIGPLPNDDLYFRAEVELVGPVSVGIQALRTAAAPASPKHELPDVLSARGAFLGFVQPETTGLAAQALLRELRAVLPEDALVTCDVGQNKSVAAQCWAAYQPKTFFVSNGLSSMGYGFAAAMGLQLLNPQRRVACILGDGGFAMYLGELETAVRRELPITLVVLADQALTQIKLGQERKGLGSTGTTFGATDYVALARAFGAEGAEIRRLEECREVFRWALERRGPTIIAAYIDPECYRLR